jgi:hypothetical protein
MKRGSLTAEFYDMQENTFEKNPNTSKDQKEKRTQIRVLTMV